MSKTLADMDVAKAGRILNQCGPAAMYDYMAEFGDKYAVLANGVARGDSLAGNAALRHMQAIAEKNGKTLTKQNIDKIRSNMAVAYLGVRTNKNGREDYTQLTAEEAQTFHRNVFTRNGLPAKAWTLEVPFDIRGKEASENLWQDILDSAGSRTKEMIVSAKISAEMTAILNGVASHRLFDEARRFFGSSDSPEQEKIDNETLRDVGEWIDINVSSFENIKEALVGSSSTQELPECIIDETTLDVESLAPRLEKPPALYNLIPTKHPPLAEPLLKRNYPVSFSETTPPPTAMHRLIQAHTPAKDALWAVSITGREALSSLYRFTVRFKSDSADLDCQAMIGERCSLELETDNQGKRWLSGQMIDFAVVGEEGRHWVYEATVAPKLWHASRRADFRIWQNQTVPDIIDEVLGDNAVRFDMRLKANYKTWGYLVQYRETDLNFILRQLEHEGIFFWFEHAEDGETLVLADHFTTHPECPGYASVPYYSGVQTRPDRDHFDGWRLTRRVETGRLIHSDYDFENPSSDLTTEHADPRGHQFDQYERFHYPGDYIDTGDGNQYAANTLERLQRGQETIYLSGRVRGAAPGHRLTLEEHPRADQNRELTLTAVTYNIADNDYEATDGSNTLRFRVDVEAIPADRPFRPSLTTPKPRTRGVETAVVVGPPGEEIHTDQYGRVKVHFHWDRYGKRDGSDTCWMRVASPWAGSNFGAIHIPRIGQEVIVDFEHGDPNRPIITGRVYNAEQMPPWDLPANQTQSGILTRSSKGGAAGAGMRDGVGDANALRFEDKKGEEEVWFHAQKDYLTEVENDESKWVGNNRSKVVDSNETDRIGNNWSAEVGSHITLQAGASITLKAGKSELVMKADGSVTLNGNTIDIVGLEKINLNQ